MAFFASPAKLYLIGRLKERNEGHSQWKPAASQPIEAPNLGLPNDPTRDIDEAVQEIKREIETMKKRGAKVSMPTEQEFWAL